MVSASAALSSLSLALAALSPSPSTLVAASSSSSQTGALSSLKYTNVGGTGTYQQVTNLLPGTFPSCDVNPSCIQTTKTVSGNLAPFDEDLTMVFRGPMTLHNIAVYQPANASGTSAWSKVSSWAAGGDGDNLVFMNNKGGSTSGTWSICGGSSQSYANAAFSDAASSPNGLAYAGNLPDGQEVNIMTNTECTSSTCDGFFRGTANEAWAGSKMFVMEVEMPSGGSTPPAIWALNSQIVRSAQYGCNCRGVGSPGGCGELDIVEVITGQDQNQGISELYSFKGATGSGSAFFTRPTSGSATYAVIFDVKTDQIAIQQWDSFDFGTGSVSRSEIDGYLTTSGKVVSFGSTNSRRSHRPVGFMGAKRRGL
ncbi:hypothetical protein OE88DRAFT_1660119 [Heliocybe sulcata]|uniref:glucan endo-1,3-beta-D-glucosidase n=1 Tax=Heliocybe sulcata TaxID=5364 RepID=A0A5C3NAV2_9AGAM|nr:hypothetical protein OE88DRAFT_1660119 [Heliocybe sulcata]